jgi:hypothetical protein
LEKALAAPATPVGAVRSRLVHTGLDPLVGAVLPLLGVLLGALATGGVTYHVRRREERAEVRQTVRLLDLELIQLKVLAQAGTTDDQPDEAARERFLRIPATWESDRKVLARWLSDEEWQALTVVIMDIQIVDELFASGGHSDGSHDAWAELGMSVARAHDLLRRHGYTA